MKASDKGFGSLFKAGIAGHKSSQQYLTLSLLGSRNSEAFGDA